MAVGVGEGKRNEFERYEGDRLHEDDAKEIFDIFLTISDYNKYVDYEEGQVDEEESNDKKESTDNDEEINEVLKIAGVK